MQRVLEYISDYKHALDRLPVDRISMVISALHEARANNRKVFVLGSGESTTTANHLAVELDKNTRVSGLPGFRVFSVASNLPLYAAYAEGDGLDFVLATQIENLLDRGDVVIAFNASGNSMQVLRAVELANRRGATTIGITGDQAGRLASIVDICITTPGANRGETLGIHQAVIQVIIRILHEDAQQVKIASQLERLYPETKKASPADKVKPLDVDITHDIHLSDKSRTSLDLFSSISRELAMELELGELLRRVLGLILQSLRATSGSILVLDGKGRILESAQAYNGDLQIPRSSQITDIIERGLAGWVVQNRKAAIITNTKDDPRWLPGSWDRDGKSKSAVSVPLLDNDKVLGVLTLVNSQGGSFTEDDLTLLATIAVFISLINYSN